MAVIEDLEEKPIPELEPLNTKPLKLPREKLDDLRQLMVYIANKDYYETLLKNIDPGKRRKHPMILFLTMIWMRMSLQTIEII